MILAERAARLAEAIQPTGYDIRVVDFTRLGTRAVRVMELIILHLLNQMNAENARLAERVATLEREGRHSKGKR